MVIKYKTIAVEVLLEKRKTREQVGILRKEKQFIFTYNPIYLKAVHSIPLGPEFPLTKREVTSDVLFPSLQDRIPLEQNPAYLEYCCALGISPDERDPLVLLSTIGSRGPSSFVFAPIYERLFTVNNVIEFRKSLQLTTREFAHIFEIQQASLNGLEKGRYSGKNLLKRLEMIVHFPQVASHFLILNGGGVRPDKLKHAFLFLKSLEDVHQK